MRLLYIIFGLTPNNVINLSLFYMSYVIYWKTLVAERGCISCISLLHTPFRYTYFDFRPVEAMDNLRTNIESPTPLHPPHIHDKKATSEATVPTRASTKPKEILLAPEVSSSSAIGPPNSYSSGVGFICLYN